MNKHISLKKVWKPQGSKWWMGPTELHDKPQPGG